MKAARGFAGPLWRGPPSLVGGPVGTVAGWALRRGFPPGPGRGSRLSLEKARTQRVAGGCPPPPPFFMTRSLPLARFGVVGRIVPVVGLFRNPCTCPDLDSHFAGAGVGCESILLQGHTTCEGFPPRGRLWAWEIPCRVSNPLPPNRLARQGSRSGRQPAKRPEGPPLTFPSNGLAR